VLLSPSVGFAKQAQEAMQLCSYASNYPQAKEKCLRGDMRNKISTLAKQGDIFLVQPKVHPKVQGGERFRLVRVAFQLVLASLGCASILPSISC
jgi:hypothetical protein